MMGLKSTTGRSYREKTYEMSDGNVFNIDNERLVLFQPSCRKEASGIHDKSLHSFGEAPCKTGWERQRQ